ncbi:MAG: hypothetical protein EOO43_05205 [Flavobacterium sp.]|nr:MAG: hypothetical protein EOO43_05205 [Flavobacterium sp.]
MPNSKKEVVREFFQLPFEKGTQKLSLKTLNAKTEFQRVKNLLYGLKTRKVSFSREILTIGLKVGNQKEEFVYLKVGFETLYISCSVDTTADFLGYYPYLYLINSFSFNETCNFKEFYWPDFFNTQTERSKYLDIINDRRGLDISFKPKYFFFFKPGDDLCVPKETVVYDRPSTNIKAVKALPFNGIGFCIADAFNGSWRSNHLPFILPYEGVVARTNDSVKTFIRFINRKNLSAFDLSPAQVALLEAGIEMQRYADLEIPKYGISSEDLSAVEQRNMAKKLSVFELWQGIIPKISLQTSLYHYFTFGGINFKERPRKSGMRICNFHHIAPQICFLWKDRGDYYELAFRFKVKGKVMEPAPQLTTYFISPENEPLDFYLFTDFADCLITEFFAGRKFKIYVLKKHFDIHFKDFLEMLQRDYQFI